MKIAVVTGASRGIGRAIAEGLERAGVIVIRTQRQPNGENAHDLPLDLADPSTINWAAEEIGRMYDHVDILINNAAILLDVDDLGLDALTAETLSETLKVNVTGTHLFTQALKPLLTKSPNGARVINMSSLAGQLSSMSTYAPAYSISKAALNALTRQQSAEYGRDGIAVNCMSPGWCRTDMGGPSAPRTAKEGADTALWLALEAPLNLTGQFLADQAQIDW